ncbi:MAG: (2Fe-2S) ferredoxin domain-containing protein [Myxococcales bacterium]|nr:(2Fe-2S) ferredoxin domain-containing protein [Myxococcales bacterium]
MAKVPTRSATHLDVDLARLAALGLELEELAADGQLALADLLQLADERGKPASHYLAALALADDLALRKNPGPVVKICAGSCQQWGALDVLEHLAARCDRAATFSLVPVGCLDRCDRAAACRIESVHGDLFVDEATPAKLDEALHALGAGSPGR